MCPHCREFAVNTVLICANTRSGNPLQSSHVHGEQEEENKHSGHSYQESTQLALP